MYASSLVCIQFTLPFEKIQNIIGHSYEKIKVFGIYENTTNIKFIRVNSKKINSNFFIF